MIAGGGTLKVEERKITPPLRQLLGLLPDLPPNFDQDRLGVAFVPCESSGKCRLGPWQTRRGFLRTIYEIERGTGPNPSAHVVKRLAEQLETTMDDLMRVIQPMAAIQQTQPFTSITSRAPTRFVLVCAQLPMC